VPSYVTVQVGERRFYTHRDTLTTESPFFSALLSERWNSAEPDGSYFVDADPGLFEHILRYLRRSVYPIFYSTSNGHDHALYHALYKEAEYFQIDHLAEYLSSQIYRNAVK
ncbi:BTB/POZ protein, partial [Cryomyces antarcticus]